MTKNADFIKTINRGTTLTGNPPCQKTPKE